MEPLKCICQKPISHFINLTNFSIQAPPAVTECEDLLFISCNGEQDRLMHITKRWRINPTVGDLSINKGNLMAWYGMYGQHWPPGDDLFQVACVWNGMATLFYRTHWWHIFWSPGIGGCLDGKKQWENSMARKLENLSKQWRILPAKTCGFEKQSMIEHDRIW